MSVIDGEDKKKTKQNPGVTLTIFWSQFHEKKNVTITAKEIITNWQISFGLYVLIQTAVDSKNNESVKLGKSVFGLLLKSVGSKGRKCFSCNF